MTHSDIKLGKYIKQRQINNKTWVEIIIVQSHILADL